MMDAFANGWVHLSANLKETFRAFLHDPFQGTSLLDHIFVNKNAAAKVKAAAAVAHDTGASDHFFLTIAFAFV